ncbi:DUF4937 domain-containing protein [Kitasatospora griseola]|uniref:DUF4937 domain-containing protein n=1 Tax=Kitasatospora griseola TaxID=2064 RepID=UPI00199F3C70|nr:DUF4937 domain-containing protein [Kitasatospora griseola]GGQ67273.1 hypothetical protein GCM10010195_23520 [Kitasatospora griseola]
MWGKWIGCEVPVAARGRFSAAQEDWSTISDQLGLVGQLGGWDPATGRAQLLGLWTDEAAYRRFMRERHDTVTVGNQQRAGCTAIDIATGGTVLAMAGDVADLPHALEHAALLRVADCRTLPGREEHFLEVQREVWAPGMAAAGACWPGSSSSSKRTATWSRPCGPALPPTSATQAGICRPCAPAPPSMVMFSR